MALDLQTLLPSTATDEDIVEWGMRSIVLTRELGGAGAGPWRPRWWQEEILRSIAGRWSRRHSLCLYSRSGKSLIAMIVLGHIISVRQHSSLFVLPSRSLIEDWNSQKMEPFFGSCPAAEELLRRNRAGKISTAGIDYRGGAGRVHYRTGRVAGGLKQLTAEVAWADEVDDCDVASHDGSYADLLHQRGEDAVAPTWVESGTPTVRGGSAIEMALELSDHREQWVTHGACGERTRYELERAEQVGGEWMMHCESCGSAIEERDRRAHLQHGIWVPRHPERSEMHRGYHLSMYYSPDHTIDEVMATWDPERIRGFYTQRLARTPPEIEIAAPEPEEFVAARQPRPDGRLVMRTVGVDCQTQRAPRLEATIVDYIGDPLDPVRYVMRHVTIFILEDSWLRGLRDLRAMLRPYRPDVVMIDVGGNRADNSERLKAAIARAWQSDWPQNRIKAIKGIGGVSSDRWPTQPAIHAERTRETTTNHRSTLSLYTDVLKMRIWEEGGVWSRGRLLFTDDLDLLPSDYWEQLTAEELRRGYRRRGAMEIEQLRWTRVSRSRPNECLDCLVYAEAGRLYLGLDYRRRSGRSVDTELLDRLIGVKDDAEGRGAAETDR